MPGRPLLVARAGDDPLPSVGEGLPVLPDALNERGQIAGSAMVEDPHPPRTISCTSGAPPRGWCRRGCCLAASDPRSRHEQQRGHRRVQRRPVGPSAFGSSGFLWTREGGYEVLALPANGLEGYPGRDQRQRLDRRRLRPRHGRLRRLLPRRAVAARRLVPRDRHAGRGVVRRDVRQQPRPGGGGLLDEGRRPRPPLHLERRGRFRGLRPARGGRLS